MHKLIILLYVDIFYYFRTKHFTPDNVRAKYSCLMNFIRTYCKIKSYKAKYNYKLNIGINIVYYKLAENLNSTIILNMMQFWWMKDRTFRMICTRL